MPEKNRVFLHAYVKGVEIYRWQRNDQSQHFDWINQGTEAVLFDEYGNLIGSHYTGPVWEFDRDGSKVSGELIASSATVDATAMPWRLFAAKPYSVPGCFRKTNYIQCVNTTGGLPPAAPTNPQVEKESRVHFTAEHIFYKPAKLSNPALARALHMKSPRE